MSDEIAKAYKKFRDCNECGKSFGYERQSRKYCSQKCADSFRHKHFYEKRKLIDGENKKCKRTECENLVRHYPNQIVAGKNRYCSTKCFGLSNMTNKPLKCKSCAKEFYVSKSQQVLRNRSTCSAKCAGKLKQPKYVGSLKKRKGLMVKAQGLCNKAARKRDVNGSTGTNCISCKIWYPYERLDGGHFIPSTASTVRFDMRNINAQCWKCNRYLSGNSRHYLKGMIAKYGQEVVDELESQEFTTRKWTVEELEQIIEKAQAYIKEMGE